MFAAALRPWNPPSVDAPVDDQARGLRVLLDQQSQRGPRPTEHPCRVVAVTSGKGGVGKSVLAVNLAVALARQGRRVGLIDANLGVSNIDLLCGLTSYWNLSHVVAGARSLDDILLEGPAGIHVLSGGSALTTLRDEPRDRQLHLVELLNQLAQQWDVLVLDVGTGLHASARHLARTADDAIVVSTAEPPAIADAYATLKGLAGPQSADLHVVVNQSPAEVAERVLDRFQVTMQTFLGTSLSLGQILPTDPAVPQSVLRREPLVQLAPHTPAARAIERLASRLDAQVRRRRSYGYFTSLIARTTARGGRES